MRFESCSTCHIAAKATAMQCYNLWVIHQQVAISISLATSTEYDRLSTVPHSSNKNQARQQLTAQLNVLAQMPCSYAQKSVLLHRRTLTVLPRLSLMVLDVFKSHTLCTRSRKVTCWKYPISSEMKSYDTATFINVMTKWLVICYHLVVTVI